MSSAATRVIVVLGYSDGGAGTIHPVCAARVARAAELATTDDVVVLSGWARVPGTRSEAELMAAAWSGVAREVVVDPDAQTTVGNARNALDDIVRVGAARGRRRDLTLACGPGGGSLPAAPAGAASMSRTAYPAEPFALWPSLRELPLWLLLPLQLWHARSR